jgi:hypothetical protein
VKRYWDDVIASVPVNRVAKKVTSRGFKYEPDKKVQTINSDAPLPMKRLSRVQQDLSGIRFGRLTAIGPFAKRRKRWVCRCDCGTYTVRTAKAVKNGDNYDACDHCLHLMYLKKNDFWRRTGKHRDGKDFD